MGFNANLKAHLESGNTSVSRAWEIARRDGVRLGFTDHDRDLAFDGLTFRAQSGLTAQALAQSTGLSVDNGEALGALSDGAISEADIRAGRYDGAAVKAWLVNWAVPDDRTLIFQGTVGEITQADAAFRAELRGSTEALNVPGGRVFQKPCAAVLGDSACGFDLSDPGYFSDAPVLEVEEDRSFSFAIMPQFAEAWFERGRFEVLDGAAKGLVGVIKSDTTTLSARKVELWEAIRADVAQGDSVRLQAGCDKRAETCKIKFSNFLNFRGFPHIPGEDWLMAYPRRGSDNDGGSLTK